MKSKATRDLTCKVVILEFTGTIKSRFIGQSETIVYVVEFEQSFVFRKAFIPFRKSMKASKVIIADDQARSIVRQLSQFGEQLLLVIFPIYFYPAQWRHFFFP